MLHQIKFFPEKYRGIYIDKHSNAFMQYMQYILCNFSFSVFFRAQSSRTSLSFGNSGMSKSCHSGKTVLHFGSEGHCIENAREIIFKKFIG